MAIRPESNNKVEIISSLLSVPLPIVTVIPYDIQHTGKGKAIPLQAWTGPEGSRRLMLPDFKTIGT